MAGRWAGGCDSGGALWTALWAAADAIGGVPAARWALESVVDVTRLSEAQDKKFSEMQDKMVAMQATLLKKMEEMTEEAWPHRGMSSLDENRREYDVGAAGRRRTGSPRRSAFAGPGRT